jgi:hypothetical protein
MRSFGKVAIISFFFIPTAGATQQQATPTDTQATATVASTLRAHNLELPASAVAPTGFLLSPEGMALVPMSGGLVLAGWKAWYIEPHGLPILAASYDEEGSLYVTRPRDTTGLGIVVFAQNRQTSRMEPISELPTGCYQITAALDSGMWAWGADSSMTFRLWYLRRGNSPISVYRSREPITAASAARHSVVILGVGNELLLLAKGHAPIRLAHLRNGTDGLAVARDGTVFVSTRAGILAMHRAGENGSFVARGLHGPMIYQDGNLFVLWRENRRVVRLSPKDSVF